MIANSVSKMQKNAIMIANSVSKLQNECFNDNKFCFNLRITTLHHKASIFLDSQGEAKWEITL